MNHPETEWLARAQGGDDQAFSRLVETYQTPVYNLCFRMLGDGGEAEDAAQETFWRAYQSIRHYDQSRPFATWLLSIAAHHCIDQLRKRRYETTPLDLLPEADIPDSAPNPESAYSQREEKLHLQRLLAALGPQDRAAIIMRYWYSFSDEEIGASLSLTVSAVKSRLHRARLELARQWQTNQAPVAPLARRKHESPAF